jgi:hypothetical protein
MPDVNCFFAGVLTISHVCVRAVVDVYSNRWSCHSRLLIVHEAPLFSWIDSRLGKKEFVEVARLRGWLLCELASN